MTAVTNYPRITLSSGLVGVVVDTSIDDTLKGKCMCEAMQHLRASAVAAMLRDPDDTSRCLLDYEAASRLTDEDYEAFWKALGYTLFDLHLAVTRLDLAKTRATVKRLLQELYPERRLQLVLR